jgi:hypothetical protein
VGDFVRRECDILVFVEALREQVAERVVFLIESKNGGVGGAWAGLSQLLCSYWVWDGLRGLTGLVLLFYFLLSVIEEEELESDFAVVVSTVRNWISVAL